MAAGMGQTAFLQYRLFMEARGQPLDRFRCTLWTTRTNSKTNTAGGSPGDTVYEDNKFQIAWDEYDRWQKSTPEERRELLDAGFGTPKPPKPETPNTNGRFNTIEGNAYYARNNQTGFQFSNRMKLSDKLSLTLMGEELENSTIRANYELNQYGVPRNGKRREYNLGFNFRYELFRWLTLTAGGRYTNFQLQDKSKRLESGTYKTGYPLEMNRGIKYSIGRVATPQEYADYKAIDDALANGSLDYGVLYATEEYAEQRKKHEQISLYSFQVNSQYIPTLKDDREKWVNPNEKVDFYWLKDDKGRLNMQDHPLTNGSIPDLHTKVPNPVYDPSIPDSPQFVPKYYAASASVYTTPMTEAERQRAMKQKGSGWVPAFSATVNFTDYSRAYLRYTETLRYPSIFEGTYGFSTATGSFKTAWAMAGGPNTPKTGKSAISMI